MDRCRKRRRLRWLPGLLGHDTRPSEAAIRAEMKIRVQEALNSMPALEREVLALRHFEQLSRAEIAAGLRHFRSRRRQALYSSARAAQTDSRTVPAAWKESGHE